MEMLRRLIAGLAGLYAGEQWQWRFPDQLLIMSERPGYEIASAWREASDGCIDGGGIGSLPLWPSGGFIGQINLHQP